MQTSSRGCFALLAIAAFAAIGCKNSATSAPLDAATPIDSGQHADVTPNLGGRGAGGGIGSGGTTGTARTGGSGGTGVGGSTSIATGLGGAGGNGGSSLAAGGAGVGGVSLGGRGGAGGAGTGGVGAGGTQLRSGGTLGAGGAATGGIPGTGGSTTGGAGGTRTGSGGLGGGATGGIPGTGGTVGVGGSATGGVVGTGGVTTPACPGSSGYVGNPAWPDKLAATAGATYCGHFKEMRNLDQEFAAKAKLSIAAGTYPLANTAGSYDFALPVCFQRRAGEPVPAFAGAGKVKTTTYQSTVNTFASTTQAATQPITVGAATGWSFSMGLVYFSWTGPPQPPVLDGSVLDRLSSGEPGDTRPGYSNALELCEGTDCDDQWQDVLFHACNPDYPLQRHTIDFAGGRIVLDVRITGAVGVTVMLAAFTAASGTLNGTAFSQSDYWKLVYSADHHHYTRNFAVLFDAPIGDACGLKVLNFWGSRFEAPLPDVYTIKCDLSNLAAVAVTSATVDQP